MQSCWANQVPQYSFLCLLHTQVVASSVIGSHVISYIVFVALILFTSNSKPLGAYVCFHVACTNPFTQLWKRDTFFEILIFKNFCQPHVFELKGKTPLTDSVDSTESAVDHAKSSDPPPESAILPAIATCLLSDATGPACVPAASTATLSPSTSSRASRPPSQSTSQARA